MVFTDLLTIKIIKQETIYWSYIEQFAEPIIW